MIRGPSKLIRQDLRAVNHYLHATPVAANLMHDRGDILNAPPRHFSPALVGLSCILLSTVIHHFKMSGPKLDDPWFERFVSVAQSHDDDRICCFFSPQFLSFHDLKEASKEVKWQRRHGIQQPSSSSGAGSGSPMKCYG